MSEETAAAKKNYRPSRMAIFGVGLIFFIILGVIAIALCRFRVDSAMQTILAQQRDLQQTWMDKSLDSIRVWRNEIVEQSRYISAAEMFRLFAVDAKRLSPEQVASLDTPEALQSNDEELRSMAEHMTYIQALLQDFTKRRAWDDARILQTNGQNLITPQFSQPLATWQVDLARKVGESGKSAFGPIYQSDKGLVMDMADPLFAVLGDAEPVAVLFLTIPMSKPLATFLARNGEQGHTLLPRLVFKNQENYQMALSRNGAITIEEVRDGLDQIANFNFTRMTSLNGAEEVYALGGRAILMDWLFVLETPVSEVDNDIQTQKMQIYGLGILGSLGIALLAAFIWAAMASKRHEAHARELQKKNDIISSQKMMLDSINSSLKDGLALVDAHQQVIASNPEFSKICSYKGPIPPYTPLVRVLPDAAALTILNYMAHLDRAREMDKSFKMEGSKASIEISLPSIVGDPDSSKRIYRLTFFPYSDMRDGKAGSGGYVVTFRDVTDFKRKAMEKREREETLLSALGRAIESVDPNLIGHSDKMANVAELLFKSLENEENQENVDYEARERSRETLRLSARLSQVGKIFVPRELLTKQGRLTPSELQEIRKAPEHADRILHDLHFDLPVRETVKMIGERVDGSGKPLGLSGSALSLEGKALAVINAFIAMTSSRAWRRDGGMSIDQAISQLRSDKGFDQTIVEALAKIPHDKLEQALKPAH